MKKIFILFIAIASSAILFTSCKKSSNTKPTTSTSYTMKFTANGTDVSFNSCQEATAQIGSVNHTLFVGNTVTNGKVSDASFEVDIIHDVTTLKAGQTFQIATSFGQATDGAVLTYFPNATDMDFTQPAKPQGTVTVTEVTSTEFKGTFSGILYDQSDFNGQTVVYTITNGSFTAKRN